MPEKAKRGAEAFRGLVYYVAEKMNIKFGKVAMKTAKHYNEKAKQKYPHIKFFISQPIGQHPQIPNLFIDLINNA